MAGGFDEVQGHGGRVPATPPLIFCKNKNFSAAVSHVIVLVNYTDIFFF
jgi:hypothetical protein